MLLVGLDPIRAFTGLLQGSLGSDAALTRTLVKATPLLLSGLAVAFAFKGGLFNIGAQGQLVIGSVAAAWVGFSLPSIPAPIHILLCLLAGVAGGALWGSIPGILKARSGAHEVISTIMLNYIASNFVEWLVSPASPTNPPGPLALCKTVGSCAEAKTANILESARLPVLYQPGGTAPDTLHIGIFIALGAAILVYLVLYRTTFGFELRMVGLNPTAAKYSGIKVGRMTILTMMISGGLAGLAGAIQSTGVFYNFQTNQSLALGFDSIAVALLAASNPIGVIPSSLLFGALDAGSTQMQFLSRVPTEIIQVISALILMFVAAEQIIRRIYRIRSASEGDKVALSTGWGHR
ncbi:MAG: ABC transporter permease [Anaerolineae bacterium]|nr:ABC transporter permease [Anaerolineae bacterium]